MAHENDENKLDQLTILQSELAETEGKLAETEGKLAETEGKLAALQAKADITQKERAILNQAFSIQMHTMGYSSAILEEILNGNIPQEKIIGSLRTLHEAIDTVINRCYGLTRNTKTAEEEKEKEEEKAIPEEGMGIG